MHVLCNAVDVVEPCEVPLCLKKTSFDLVGMPTVHLAVNVSSPASLEGNSSVYILYIICVYIYHIVNNSENVRRINGICIFAMCLL